MLWCPAQVYLSGLRPSVLQLLDVLAPVAYGSTLLWEFHLIEGASLPKFMPPL